MGHIIPPWTSTDTQDFPQSAAPRCGQPRVEAGAGRGADGVPALTCPGT